MELVAGWQAGGKQCYMRLVAIAEHLRVSVSTASRIKRDLVSIGILSSSNRRGRGCLLWLRHPSVAAKPASEIKAGCTGAETSKPPPSEALKTGNSSKAGPLYKYVARSERPTCSVIVTDLLGQNDRHTKHTKKHTTKQKTKPPESAEVEPVDKSEKPPLELIDLAATFDEKDAVLAVWIYSKIKERDKNAPPPNMKKWKTEIRLMREKENRAYDEIIAVFSFANAHDFWAANVLCPSKLRGRFTQLLTAMKTAPPKKTRYSCLELAQGKHLAAANATPALKNSATEIARLSAEFDALRLNGDKASS